jgi:hypothetical protein
MFTKKFYETEHSRGIKMKHQLTIEMNRIGQCGRTIFNGWKRPAILLALLVLFTSAAFAQLTTADILGTVVPNASVVLTNIGTNEKRTTTSNGSGDYSFNILPVGHYSISVKATGFETAITKDLSPSKQATAPVTTCISQRVQSQVVEVTASTPLLQADSATVSSTVTAKAVQDLP